MKTPQGQSRAFWLRIVGGVLVGAGCLWLSLRQVAVERFSAALAGVSWPWVALATLGIIIIAAAKALRWQWLYAAGMARLSWRRHFSVLMISQMLNLLAPVRLGELARLELMRREGRPIGATLGAIVLEKSLDLIAVQALLLLAVPLAILPAWLVQRTGWGFLSAGVLLFAILLLVARKRDRLLGLLRRIPPPTGGFWAQWAGRLRRLVETTLESIAGLDGPRLLRVLLLTTGIWLASVATLRAMLGAFGSPSGWGAAFVLMLALTFSNWVPTPPALIGVVGAVAVAVLAPFGVPAAQALALGTVLNAVLVLPPTLLGIWGTWEALWRLRSTGGAASLRQVLGLAAQEPTET